MPGKLIIEAILSDKAGGELANLLPESGAPRRGAEALSKLLMQLASGNARGRIRVSGDTSVGVAATIAVTVAQATATAGDVLVVAGVPLTCVAGAATAGANTYSKDTSDNAEALSLEVCINTSPQLRGIVTALASSAVVTISAVAKGTPGNSLECRKVVTTAGTFAFTGSALAGGVDAGGKQSLTFTLTDVGTANDTLVIGGQTLTLVASAANENQITIGATAGATATAMATAINVHTLLKGLLYATASGTSTGILTITLLIGGRIGKLILLSKSCSVGTLSATTFVSSTTETYALGAGGVEYSYGSL